MVTDTEKMEAVLDNPVILITEKKISNIQEILPLLEQIMQVGKKLLIISEDVEGEALATLVATAIPPRSRPASPPSVPRSRRPPPITTVRSFRNVWRSWLAAWPWSMWALPPKLR